MKTAARMLGDYSTLEAVSTAVNIPIETVCSWASDPEFSAGTASQRASA